MSDYAKELQKKYSKIGIDNLSESEKLELVLSFTKEKRIREKSKYIMKEYGSLKSLFNANVEYLLSDDNDDNISENSATLIKLIQYISKEYLKSSNRYFINNKKNAIRYFQALYMGEAEEKLYIISVDSKMEVTNSYLISSGSFNNVEVPLRKIIDCVMSMKSLFGIFISHNHPCSNSEPSPADIELTDAVISILHSYKIKVFDHIIVGMNSLTSLKSLVKDINFDYASQYECFPVF